MKAGVGKVGIGTCAAALLLFTAPVHSQPTGPPASGKTRPLVIAAGPDQSSYSLVGHILARRLNAVPGRRFSVDPQGPGSKSNLERLLKGEADFAISQADVALAYVSGRLDLPAGKGSTPAVEAVLP